MRIRCSLAVLTALSLFGLTAIAAAQQSVTIRAGLLLDGKGGMQRNAVVTVHGTRIAKVGDSAAESVTYDFSRLSVMPGMIDTHVHIGAHFGPCLERGRDAGRGGIRRRCERIRHADGGLHHRPEHRSARRRAPA